MRQARAEGPCDDVLAPSAEAEIIAKSKLFGVLSAVLLLVRWLKFLESELKSIWCCHL